MFTGVIDDIRDAAAKALDWKHSEVAGDPAPALFASEPQISVSLYPVEDQKQTNSCIPHGVTLAYGIETKDVNGAFARLSKTMPYRIRSNFPNPGMWLQECMNIMNNVGSCLYETAPDVESDQIANQLVITDEMGAEASIYKGTAYYTLDDPTDFDAVAALAGSGKAVPIVIWASINEWLAQYVYPQQGTEVATAPVRHCVCVVPEGNFATAGGRFVTIQDSVPWGGHTIRYVSEAFLRARCIDAAYFTKEDLQRGVGPVPSHDFDQRNVLSMGMSGTEVKALQDVLIYEGLLPTGLDTGYFGARTLAGVKAFQDRYAADVLTPLGLSASTGVAGASTLSKCNALYGSGQGAGTITI